MTTDQTLNPNLKLAPTTHDEYSTDQNEAIYDNDHDVDRKRSFNGRLGQFLHQPMTTTTTTSTQQHPIQSPQQRRIITRSKSSSLSPSASLPSSSPSPSPSKRKPLKRKRSPHKTVISSTPFSPPSRLRDTIPANLILLLIGVNPGLMTGSTGYAYAHPSNLFWKLLYSSGITTVRHAPSDTYKLPALYAVGNTNIVERPTRDASMLSKAEMDAGVAVLEAKIASQKPEAVALVGKSIWESIWRVRHGRAIRKEEFRYGWQDEGENMGVCIDDSGGADEEGWKGARVFVATTTSGLAATMSLQEKQLVWNELGEWVKRRREERGFVPGTVGTAAT
ncbi:uracil-DNA glycosylase-like protein [Talaromyces proteolyticus]|uniref:Uracil-DNA glycosylase-like protein n=1 Tax=Talaromyces proteolyticus TaxID=1131652 RepID=A0AAD4L404_9EURO|nr:uracil-DNA glycosylase-like protein [Talaromyces proteolyticus]KAH8703152.1 uracil-DNA glycosylase-like protein [Talaromyces proteolyticus]